MMRRFILIRHEDISGVSGCGVVAHGVEYDDGHISMQWCDSPSKLPVSFESIDVLLTVHGHGGKTVHRWLDPQHQAFVSPYRDPIGSAIAAMDRRRHPQDYADVSEG